MPETIYGHEIIDTIQRVHTKMQEAFQKAFEQVNDQSALQGRRGRLGNFRIVLLKKLQATKQNTKEWTLDRDFQTYKELTTVAIKIRHVLSQETNTKGSLEYLGQQYIELLEAFIDEEMDTFRNRINAAAAREDGIKVPPANPKVANCPTPPTDEEARTVYLDYLAQHSPEDIVAFIDLMVEKTEASESTLISKLTAEGWNIHCFKQLQGCRTDYALAAEYLEKFERGNTQGITVGMHTHNALYIAFAYLQRIWGDDFLPNVSAKKIHRLYRELQQFRDKKKASQMGRSVSDSQDIIPTNTPASSDTKVQEEGAITHTTEATDMSLAAPEVAEGAQETDEWSGLDPVLRQKLRVLIRNAQIEPRQKGRKRAFEAHHIRAIAEVFGICMDYGISTTPLETAFNANQQALCVAVLGWNKRNPDASIDLWTTEEERILQNLAADIKGNLPNVMPADHPLRRKIVVWMRLWKKKNHRKTVSDDAINDVEVPRHRLIGIETPFIGSSLHELAPELFPAPAAEQNDSPDVAVSMPPIAATDQRDDRRKEVADVPMDTSDAEEGKGEEALNAEMQTLPSDDTPCVEEAPQAITSPLQSHVTETPRITDDPIIARLLDQRQQFLDLLQEAGRYLHETDGAMMHWLYRQAEHRSGNGHTRRVTVSPTGEVHIPEGTDGTIIIRETDGTTTTINLGQMNAPSQ